MYTNQVSVDKKKLDISIKTLEIQKEILASSKRNEKLNGAIWKELRILNMTSGQKDIIISNEKHGADDEYNYGGCLSRWKVQ
jgi:hypothetical protein